MKLILKKSVGSKPSAEINRSFRKSGSLGFKRVGEDVLKKQQEEVGKSGDFISYIKGKYTIYSIKDEEPNFIRILPPLEDDPHNDFMRKVWIHSFMPVDGSYVCIEKMKIGKFCPICDIYRTIKAKGINEELAYSVAPKERYLFQIIDTSDKPQSEGMLILDSPSTLKDMIVGLCHPPRKGLYNVSDPDEGREVIFVRASVSNKKYPQYKSAQLGDEIKIDSSYASIIAPFDDLYVVPELEELETVAKYLKEAIKSDSGGEEESHRERVTSRDEGGDAGVKSGKLRLIRKKILY